MLRLHGSCSSEGSKTSEDEARLEGTGKEGEEVVEPGVAAPGRVIAGRMRRRRRSGMEEKVVVVDLVGEKGERGRGVKKLRWA